MFLPFQHHDHLDDPWSVVYIIKPQHPLVPVPSGVDLDWVSATLGVIRWQGVIWTGIFMLFPENPDQEGFKMYLKSTCMIGIWLA